MRARIIDVLNKHAAGRSCYLCKAAPRNRPKSTHPTGKERLVDTGVHIEFEGYVQICETCVSILAGLFGYITPDVATKLGARVVELEAGNAGLIEIASKHSGLVAALNTAGVEVPGEEPELVLEVDLESVSA